MKKIVICICIALLLCGCASHSDSRVEQLEMQLAQLPAMGDLARMDQRQQMQEYERIHSLYGQYMSLSPLQKLQLPEAKEIFADRFDWFRGYGWTAETEAPETEPASLPTAPEETQAETVPVTVPEETVSETVPQTVPETTVPETVPETIPETVPETTAREVVVKLTEEEQDLLLRLAMAERGEEECAHCLALIMRTVLNRVESGFGSSVRKVIYAQDQFAPAMDGSLEDAKPNDACREALDMVIHGWDESGGALFYEWVEGDTWHSRSLKLTAEHCDGQFYKR